MAKKITFSACVLVIATLTACQGTSMDTNISTQPSQTTKSSQTQSLNQQWVFDGVISAKDEHLQHLPAGTFVGFYQDKLEKTTSVVASVGCNNKQDQATIDLNKQTISMHGQMISTMMSCGELDAIEDVFADFVANLISYRFDGSKLILMDKLGNALAFRAMTIEGDWQLVDGDGFDVASSQAVTVSLRDGKGHAYAGCNQLNFAYQDLGGQKISIDGVASTRMACMDVPFEQVLVSFLPNAVRYQLQGDQLMLVDKVGNRLFFTPSPK